MGRYHYGRASCPICHEEICGPSDKLSIFLKHVATEHTIDERTDNKSSLVALFRPLMNYSTLQHRYVISSLEDEEVELIGSLLSELSESTDDFLESIIDDGKQQQN